LLSIQTSIERRHGGGRITLPEVDLAGSAA
jgi:hypothetical protein